MRPLSVALLLLSSQQIETRLHQLRQLSDAERIKVTQQLALEIRRLPATAKKEPLAEQLCATSMWHQATSAAMEKLEADDRGRRHADFTLTDLNGMQWSLHDLAGKVVLVNFWATRCPPCRKDLPDLEALYQEGRNVNELFTVE